MKKLVLTLTLLMGVAAQLNANPLAGQFVGTLLEHVSVTALVQSGETDVALLDTIVQVGRYNGEHVLGLQAGFSGSTVPAEGEASGAKYLVGATLRLSPFLKGSVTLPEHWEFLRALEFGPSYHYDLRDQEEIWGLSVGLAFDPQPKQ